MTGFADVQTALDRILGDHSAGNHEAFWRGKTRDEFVEHVVFGFKVVEIGAPGSSNLVHALRARAPFGSDTVPPTPGAFIPRMPAFLQAAEEPDIVLIEDWISDGCPETSNGGAGLAVPTATDDDHVRYWRELDTFFLPGHASPETSTHVNRWHAAIFGTFLAGVVQNPAGPIWPNFLANAQVIESFEYIRHHQRRLISDHYADDPDNVYDSLWKFGADLLPRDTQSPIAPEHRMNGITDWFFWVPHMHTTLAAADITDIDLAHARGWHIGIAADGLLRRDPQRPSPIPIPEFDASAPDLRDTVIAHYRAMDAPQLTDAMLARTRTQFP